MMIISTFLGVILSYLIYSTFKKRAQKRSKIGECSLCGDIYADKDLSIQNELSLCPLDLKYYTDHKWIEIKRAISHPDKPENSISIYEEKLRLVSSGVKCFILTEYSEEENIIYTIFKLYVPSNEAGNI